MTLNFTTESAYRKKWMPNLFQEVLKKAVVSFDICAVDYSDVKYIENPYGSVSSVTQQAIAGTYSIADFDVTADTLTVTEEFVWSEQVYDFEQVASVANVKGSRMKDAMVAMGVAIDKYVLNALLDAGTTTYSTPAGGFATSANVNEIMGQLSGKVAGYAEVFNGLYLVVESTDIPGIVQSGMASGFSFADTWLRNGLAAKNIYAGFDLYVVRPSTFVTATLGTTAFTNLNHRVAGVKGVSTICMPGGRSRWMEKEVSGKTGVELAMVAYVGFKAWFQKLALTVDITLT